MGALIGLLREFEITETSARAAVKRLVARGMLQSQRSGRQAYLRLSDSGRQQIRQNFSVVQFGVEPHDWDGMWTLAAFSIPEEQRPIRHRIRNSLRWLGFAPLFDGLWVSPHAAPATLTRVFQSAGVAKVSILRASEAGGSSPLSAWNLPEVGDAYRQFITQQQDLAVRASSGSVTPSEALAARVELLETWRQFPGLDPDLPAKLLPDDWPRAEARALFVSLYDNLGPLAELRFQQLVAPYGENLAGLATHHTTSTWGTTDRSA